MRDSPVNGWHWREWGSEFLGTAALMFGVLTALYLTISAGQPVSSLWVRLPIISVVAGAVVVIVAWSPLGRRSGVHLNPAVTLGLWLQRVAGTADLAGYSLSQLGGAAFGIALGRVWGPRIAESPVSWAQISPAPWIPFIAAAAVEAVATALQLAIVFGLLSSARWRKWAALAAGAALAVCITSLAPVSGAGFNPARAFGPDVLANSYGSLWVFFAGPLLGAIVAGGSCTVAKLRPRTGKLWHSPTVPCYMACELFHGVSDSTAR